MTLSFSSSIENPIFRQQVACSMRIQNSVVGKNKHMILCLGATLVEKFRLFLLGQIPKYLIVKRKQKRRQ